jgi:hypothetical protein
LQSVLDGSIASRCDEMVEFDRRDYRARGRRLGVLLKKTSQAEEQVDLFSRRHPMK